MALLGSEQCTVQEGRNQLGFWWNDIGQTSNTIKRRSKCIRVLFE